MTWADTPLHTDETRLGASCSMLSWSRAKAFHQQQRRYELCEPSSQPAQNNDCRTIFELSIFFYFFGKQSLAALASLNIKTPSSPSLPASLTTWLHALLSEPTQGLLERVKLPQLLLSPPDSSSYRFSFL